MEDKVSWLSRSNNHFAMWKPLLNHIWVPEALNRPQKGLSIKLNGNFSQPYSILDFLLTKTDGFLTRWVDCHFPTIVLVYGNIFWTIYVSLRPQKRPNTVLYGMFSQTYIQYLVRARAYVRSRLFPCHIFPKEMMTTKEQIYYQPLMGIVNT